MLIRKIIPVFLCAVLIFPLGMKVSITANFLINQDFIAANLCENRDKPELHCNGKCVLMQKLNLSEDKSREPVRIPEMLRFEISSFLYSDYQFNLSLISGESFTSVLPYSDRFVKRIYPHDIFHPPRLVV